MKKSLYILAIFALLLQPGGNVVASPAQAPAYTIYHVIPGGTGNCTGWGISACDLQTALQHPNLTAGDEIWVRYGTYTPTTGGDRSISFALKSGVAVYGGFDGTEMQREQRRPAEHLTTLSGEIGAAGIADNSYHVVRAENVSAGARLDGFTVTGGNASDAPGAPEEWGGGILIRGTESTWSNPTIENVHFINNSAKSGGGMFIQQGDPALVSVSFELNNATINGGGLHTNHFSSPTLTNVTFSANSAAEYGGGMCNFDSSAPSMTGGSFTNNTSKNGGGMYNDSSNAVLAGVSFIGNTATDITATTGIGGGIYNYNNSPTLTDVTFLRNKARLHGGGMINMLSSPRLRNVAFIANFAGRFNGTGGGYAGGLEFMNCNPVTTELVNVLFTANHAGESGGMILTNCSPEMTNVTFAGNTADESSGWMANYEGSNPHLTNVIVWGNSPAQIYNNGSAPVINYSDIQGGAAGTKNINLNPLFVRNPSAGPDGIWGTADDDPGDLRLHLTSPAIDAGDNSAVPFGVLTDLLGLPRFFNIPSVPDSGNGTAPIVDMGTYEAHPILYLPVVSK